MRCPHQISSDKFAWFICWGCQSDRPCTTIQLQKKELGSRVKVYVTGITGCRNHAASLVLRTIVLRVLCSPYVLRWMHTLTPEQAQCILRLLGFIRVTSYAGTVILSLAGDIDMGSQLVPAWLSDQRLLCKASVALSYYTSFRAPCSIGMCSHSKSAIWWPLFPG